MPKFTLFLVLACLFAGCTKTVDLSPPPNAARAVKVTTPYEPNNTAIMDAEMDQTLEAAYRYFAKSPFVVKSTNNKNKEIHIDFMLPTPANYLDCGWFIDRIDGVEQEPIKYIQQVTNTGSPGSDKVFGDAILYFSEISGKTEIEVMATIHLQNRLSTYSQELTYVNETRFSSELVRINDQWVTIKNPYTVEVPIYGPAVKNSTTRTRTARTVYVHNPENDGNKWTGYSGFDCHSTQQLEQTILQGIAGELDTKK